MRQSASKSWFLALAAGIAALCAACSSGIPASQIKNITEFVDGVAVVETTDGKHVFVDEDFKPVGKKSYEQLSDFVNGYAIGYNRDFFYVKGNKSYFDAYYVIDRKGNVVLESNNEFESGILKGGRIWVDVDNGKKTFDYVNWSERECTNIQLIDLASGRTLIDEAASMWSCAPSGVSVLVREHSNRHPAWYENANLVEFMMVNADGRVIVPWGRIGYIGRFSNGLAAATHNESGRRLQHREVYARRHGHAYTNMPDFGFINESGEMVIPEQFNEVSDFNDAGYARVRKHISFANSSPYRFIDRTGRLLSGAEEEKARRSFLDMKEINHTY